MSSREPGLFASMERLRDKIRSTFWVVPALCVLGSTVLAVVLISVDHALDTKGPGTFFHPGRPEGERSLLSSVVTAMISFTGLVFSITILVLQLTSRQFSPVCCASSCVTGPSDFHLASSSQHLPTP